ncbi:MAG: preprotein translocase subunit SecG [Pirellulaceae bacterium]|nr:preprotein translocase subunit SecG [Pirellulaceae bacterium]
MTFVLLAATVWHYFFGIFIFLSSVFLILLVLVQRGRGGGLTGALGGMGGQSAFGTKAGDVFTKITVVTAAIWIILCMGAIWVLGSHDEWADSSDGGGNMSSDTSGDQDGETGDSTEPAGSGDSGAAGEGGGAGTTDSGGTSTPASSGTAAPGDTSGGDDN